MTKEYEEMIENILNIVLRNCYVDDIPDKNGNAKVEINDKQAKSELDKFLRKLLLEGLK